MGNSTRYVGLDVHAATISVAVCEGRGEARSLGVIPNDPDAVRKLIAKLGDRRSLRVCYEAGPTGYVLYWQLTGLSVQCEVVAPSLVPTRPGDVVKTDRRDAEKLARAYRSGDLTAVWVPDAAHEALRDLVRAREAAKKDELRAKHRLTKYLLRNGLRCPQRCMAFTLTWWRWLSTLQLEHAAQRQTLLDYKTEVEHQGHRIARLETVLDEAVTEAPVHMKAVIDALQSMRGVAKVTAITLAVEVGSFERFAHPKQLMSYSGLVPREHSSGSRQRRGSISKTGSAHLRRVLVEAAWHYRHPPRLSNRQKKLQTELPTRVLEIAWNAQLRLHRRHHRLTARGKPSCQVVTALGRELIGFIWDIARRAEQDALAANKH